jgi:hypothetical protein
LSSSEKLDKAPLNGNGLAQTHFSELKTEQNEEIFEKK